MNSVGMPSAGHLPVPAPVIKPHGDPPRGHNFRTTFSKLKTQHTVFHDCHSQQRTAERVLLRSMTWLAVIIMITNRENLVILRLIPFKANTSRSNSELERGKGAPRR